MQKPTTNAALRFGVCVGSEEKYQRYARPGLERIAALDRTVERRGSRSIFKAYNEVIDQVIASPGLGGLVLLHEDYEIRDDDFEGKMLRLLGEDVAIIGTIGGRRPTSVQWWQAEQVLGRQRDAYYGDVDHGGGTHEVDVVDGCVLVLSPWAVRNLRFDERYKGFHGYDADICMQARAAGKRVLVTEIDAFHHTKGGYGDEVRHQRTDDRFRKKWNLPPEQLHVRLRRGHPVLWQLYRTAGRFR